MAFAKQAEGSSSYDKTAKPQSGRVARFGVARFGVARFGNQNPFAKQAEGSSSFTKVAQP